MRAEALFCNTDPRNIVRPTVGFLSEYEVKKYTNKNVAVALQLGKACDRVFPSFGQSLTLSPRSWKRTTMCPRMLRSFQMWLTVLIFCTERKSRVLSNQWPQVRCHFLSANRGVFVTNPVRFSSDNVLLQSRFRSIKINVDNDAMYISWTDNDRIRLHQPSSSFFYTHTHTQIVKYS